MKKHKLTNEELCERDEKRMRFYPDIIGLTLAGAFVGSDKFWNQGDLFSASEFFNNILGCAMLSILLGLGAKCIYVYYINNRESFDHVGLLSLVISVALVLFVTYFAAVMIKSQDYDKKCAKCDKRVSTENGFELNGSKWICDECVTDGLKSFEYGFCEWCNQPYQIDEMTNGYCDDCFNWNNGYPDE